MLSRPINWVNARLIAGERGIGVTESRASKTEQTYATTLTVTVSGDEVGDIRSITGVVFDGREGRFVEVSGIMSLEAVPEGYLLIIANRNNRGLLGTSDSTGRQRYQHIADASEASDIKTGRAPSRW
ncbi:MAG: hypothetical protein R3C68_09505 [Myxococcota bacterium]